MLACLLSGPFMSSISLSLFPWPLSLLSLDGSELYTYAHTHVYICTYMCVCVKHIFSSVERRLTFEGRESFLLCCVVYPSALMSYMLVLAAEWVGPAEWAHRIG